MENLLFVLIYFAYLGNVIKLNNGKILLFMF